MSSQEATTKRILYFVDGSILLLVLLFIIIIKLNTKFIKILVHTNVLSFVYTYYIKRNRK